MNHEDLLWQRVLALRGIPKHDPRAAILGERFQVVVARARAGNARQIEDASRLAGTPGCRGVVGEILVENAGLARRAADPAAAYPLGWRRALIESEAERLARAQPGRRTRQITARGGHQVAS